MCGVKMDHITLYLLGIFILSTGQVSGLYFRASLPSVIIGGPNPTSALNITCSPNATGITSVFVIEIGRTSLNGTVNPIIQIDNTNHTLVVINNTNIQQRMSASGSISGSTGSLMMYLRDLRCEDATLYYCKASVNTAYGSSKDEGTLYISVQTNPETIEMTVTPDLPQHHAGDVVTFSCHGTIGNQEGSMETLWHWKWRDTTDSNPQWMPYPNTINITYNHKQSSGTCRYTARSNLTHEVKTTDNGREFRCYFYTDIFGANKTFYVGSATIGPSPQRTDSTANSGQDMLLSSVVTTGLGLMLVLAVI